MLSEHKHPHDQPPPYQEESDEQRVSEGLPLYEDNELPVQHSNDSHGQLDETRPVRKGCCSRLLSIIRFAVIFLVVGIISINALRILSHSLTPSRPRPGPGPHCGKPPSSSHKGHIDENRRYTRRESIKSITGDFPLYDLLDLSTWSGSIDVTVTPHPGSEPAVLRLWSGTGSVTVRLSERFQSTTRSLRVQTPGAINMNPSLASLNRTFNTEIKSRVGAIRATVLGGNGGETIVESQAGSIDLDLLTVGVGPDDDVTFLRTQSHVGQQTIRVAPYDPFGAGKIVKLLGSHVSQGSGALDIEYPRKWEGELDASIYGSGSLDVMCDGLDIVDQHGTVLKGYKGKGGEKVEIVNQGSGSLKFGC